MPSTPEPTCAQRAERVSAAVALYAASHDTGEPPHAVITDMIADLCHYLAAVGLDVEDVVAMGLYHYGREVLEEKGA